VFEIVNGLLFPGQGSQTVGMGRELYRRLDAARLLLDRAGDVLGYDLKTIMFDGPEELLTDTKYAQPAIFTCSAMYLEKAKADGIEYEYVAGHSLGEYDALLAAGVFGFEDGLRLVAKRGEAMSRMNGRGTMAAVMGIAEEELKTMLLPGVVMANLNARTQIVISGEESGIDEIGRRLEGNESVRFKKLRVSAAFHSPQMAEASAVMKAELDRQPFELPRCHVVSNVTGRASRDPAEIKENLVKQITGQVRWYDTIMTMKEAGVEMLYETGYGDVLKKMNKTITFRPKCIGIEVGEHADL
jgi:[acyl-carrier-protein] S-malonyltransferase